MIRAALPRLVTLCLAAALAACASSAAEKKEAAPAEPAAKPEPVTTTTAVVQQPSDPNDKRARLAQTMVDLDKRIDRYALLGSQGGDEARAERGLLGPALSAQVLQYKRELLAMAADPSEPQLRRTAVKALAFSEDPAAVPVLVACLSVKDDPRLVTNATYALARLKSPTTPVEPLLALIRDQDHDIRSNALLALWHIFDAKRKAGGSPLDPIQAQQAMPLFEVALFDPSDPLVRAHAAAALGALGDKRAVDPLLNLLRDEHPLVRTHTALALGKLGDVKAVPHLVKTIDATPAGTPRSAVIVALTMLMDKSGHKVPPTLGDSGRAWESWVRQVMGASPPK